MRIFFLCCVAVFSLLSCKTEVNDVGNVPERGFHSNRPANIWEESLVTGNGVMGAMVMGDPYRESIVLNHALLYLPIHSPRKPVSQGKNLEKIQQMMLDGKLRRLLSLLSTWLIPRGTKVNTQQTFSFRHFNSTFQAILLL